MTIHDYPADLNDGTAPARPLWVCLEGPNGIGKTHLATALAARLGTDCCLLRELSDASDDQVVAQVMGALAAAGDAFLRTGHPLTETFTLLALKVREHELVDRLPEPPRIVLEDRGVDTVAVYQAAIMTNGLDTYSGTDDERDEAAWELVQQIHTTVLPWRPLPDLTMLITDDPESCARRWQQREGSPLTPDQRRLVDRVTRLYQRQAEHDPERIRVIARDGHDTGELLDELQYLVLAAAGGAR